MATFWGKLFKKKESPVFQARVGEGLNEEQTKKAYETIAKPDTAMEEAKAKSFWGKTKAAVKEAYTPVETEVRFPFQIEPTKVQAAPITKEAARMTFDLIEAIPRFVATAGGEFKAGFKPESVKANIDLRRFGFEKPEYQTASKEVLDAINNGENPWIAGLRTFSNKTLDVAFGASMVSDLAKMSTAVLLRGGSEARIEAQNIVDAYKANQKETFRRLKDAPLAQREKALADITNLKNQAEKTLNELGKPTAVDKLKVSAARYTEMLGRETQIKKGFWGDFAKPDIGLKTKVSPNIPALEVKQLPGTRETPGQAPAMGLSMRSIENVGKEEARLAISKELAMYKDTPLTVNGKPYIIDTDSEFILMQLKEKDASGKTLTNKEVEEAAAAFTKLGIDPFRTYPTETVTPEPSKYKSLDEFISEEEAKPIVDTKEKIKEEVLSKPTKDLVKEKKLLVVHNLNDQKLRFANRIGGLANPSMAVINPKVTPFDNYGDISLIGSKDLIEGEKTHLADAYSPRFPSVYTTMSWDDFTRLEKDMQPYYDKIGKDARKIYHDDSEMARYIENNPSVMLKFLEENKIKPTTEGYNYYYTQIEKAGLVDKYNSFLDDFYKKYNLKEQMFAGYTPNGNRRYKPVTLEEASKIMGKQKEEGMNYGLGSYRSKIAPVTKSTSIIQKEAGRLISKDDFEKVKESFNDELYGLRDKLGKYVKHKDSNSFIENDRQLDTIGAVLSGEKDAWKYFNQKFPDAPSKIINEVIAFKNKLKAMPTEYFETKFKRPVKLNEFSKAVVPDSISAETRKILEDNGLEVITFAPGKKGDVLKGLLSSKESFSKRPIFNRDVYMGSDEVRKIIMDGIGKAGYTEADLKVLFSDEALGDDALGIFEQENRWLGDLIRLYEKDGKVGIVTALHEQKHFLFSKLSPELQQEAYDVAKEEMGVMYKKILEKGYKPEGKYAGENRENALLEEYIVDKWAKAEAGAEFGYKQSVYGRVFEALDNLITKIVNTYKKIKDYIKSIPNQQGGFVRIIPEKGTDIEAIKDQISFLEGSLSEHPGKILMKYVSKTTGRLPEITGKKTMMDLAGKGKIVKTSKFGVEGDQILQEIAGYGKDPDEIIEQYKSIKDSVADLKNQIKEHNTTQKLARISEKLAKHQQKMIEFAKKYPKLAQLTMKLNEAETKGAIKGYKLGTEVANRTIKKEVMDKIKTAYDKRVEKIKTAKDVLDSRRALIKAVQKQFGLGDDDLKAITRRDIRLMSNFEFKQFLDDIRSKSEEFMIRRQAQNQLEAQINEKELNIEPLREAMNLPPISQMNTTQLRDLDNLLEGYQKGDVFLSKRKLQTINRTELANARTYREVREMLSKKLGMNVADLNNIKIKEFDRFKSFASLAEKDPFFKMVVEDTAKLKLQAEAEYLEIEKKANDLAKKVKTTFIQKLIPQQKNIRAWFEAEDKSTVRLTKEESDLVNFMVQEWSKVRDQLVENQFMKQGIKSENYFTHIRRGVLEAIKEDGIKQAIKEIFDQYKMDEQSFNILDTETGQVLAMDKFFRFALRRTGGMKPTENILGAFLNYMKIYKKKQALDEIVPLIDTYANALTPKGTTQKGLLLHGDMIRFMKEWLNTQKGRRITLLSKQGGKIDWALKSIKAFTTFMDIGLNIPVSLATQIGEQTIQYQLLGKRKFALAKYRALTKRGRRITAKYRNVIGKNPWTQLVEPMRSIGDRLNEGIFAMFQDANVGRNRNVLLGMMTKDEWKNEAITPERLAQIQIATSRYGVVEGLGSIVGATPESKIATQYKTWAIPILSSQAKNLYYISKYLRTLGKAEKFKAKRAATELYRMMELGLFVAIAGSAFVDKEDDSFLGKLKQRAYQEAQTLFGAAPAMVTVPRMIQFATDLSKNTISLLKLERYKANKFGEYEAGDLKGLKALGKQITPRAIKQFEGTPKKTLADIKKEIKDQIESGELSVPAAKEKFVNELKQLKQSEKKDRMKLKPDEYKKTLAEMVKNKELTVSEAKDEYIDYVEENVDSFTSKDEGSFIDKVLLYSKAIGTDPVTASVLLFQGETIRRIDNGAIIVKRMPLAESQAIKKEQGATKDMILDHTIPLELGGSNNKNNLKLVNVDEWESYTPIENYLGNKLRSGLITKKEAQQLIQDFKDGKIKAEEIMQ